MGRNRAEREMREGKRAEGRGGVRFVVLVLVPVLGAVLGVALCVGIGIWNDYRDAVIDAQKQQMLLAVQSLGEGMEVFVRGYGEDLEGIYKMARRGWGAGRAGADTAGNGQEPVLGDILREYVDTHSTFVDDVIVEGANGEVIGSTKGIGVQKLYSSSRIDGKKSLRMVGMEDGEMCLVLRMEAAGEGAFSIVLNMERYYQNLMHGLQVGTNGYMVLKDSDGIILMHPERAQWGIEVIGGRMGMYEGVDLGSLKAMISRQKEGRAGVDEYYSYWWTKEGYPRVHKISAYCPVQVGEEFLVLSAVMDYDDIYIPVARGVFRLVLLFLVFFLVMVAMAWYIVRMFLQKQKDTEQIAYLTELNRLLEEMHRSEEAVAHQQRLQIMGTMTGGIAHEFNNLLTPIMGYADLLLLELDEGSDLYDSALEIYEASAKAKEMIQQISSLSRKNLETAYKDMDGARMLSRALKMVRSVCPANILLEEEVNLEGAHVLCNETQMNQVVLNICVNAIHAIDHREGRIRIRAWVAGREDLEKLDPASRYLFPALENWKRYIGIEIRDNGCGMSREVKNQMFDPFFTTKKGGKGTGLGLALVEQIISSHKGGLFVESEPGRGSAFFVYLPVNEQGGGQWAAAGRGAVGTGAKEKESLRLLIVDDNPKVLRLLEKDAGKLKISLECRLNFEEARKVLRGQTEGDGGGKNRDGRSGRDKAGGEGSAKERAGFDALVAEQEIAGQSGVDFCMSLQGKYPGMAMIVMANRVTRELVEAKQRRFIDAYIDKPVSISSILEALKENLNDL